jgi:hypothetical protein
MQGTPVPRIPPVVILDKIYEMKRRVDAGTLPPDEFARSRAEMMTATAIPGTPSSAPSAPQRELAKLDWLRDRAAVSGPEYLELRRRILFR